MAATDTTDNPNPGGERPANQAAAGSTTLADTPPGGSGQAESGFSRSIIISGIRCTLTYVLLPFVAPWIGLAPGVGPVVGLVIGTIAIVANLFSIRRFWRADHKWKIHATVLHVAVLILLT
ncbi:MAG: hypothetical protein ACRBK7_26905, partial [Acidimicrobiales bacterium]